MIGEIWTYNAVKPNDNIEKSRPVLIIGNDANNNLKFVDIHYVIISSSASCGIYDVKITEETARDIGLAQASVIKTKKFIQGQKQS